MIDSFIFRIKDLKRNASLVKFLKKTYVSGLQVTENVIDRVGNISADEMHLRFKEYLNETPNPDFNELVERVYKGSNEELMEKSKLLFRKTYTDHKTMKSFDSGWRDFIRSHNYNIAYNVNDNRDYVEFNFSIPKLMYGTNLFQFVNHFWHPSAFVVNSAGISSELFQRDCFKRLQIFMEWFFVKRLGDTLISFDDVYIQRIDFVFERVFLTRQDALYYLSDIKGVKKKYIRDTSKAFSSYHSGVYFAGQNFTYKIYHKGSEFKVHDRPNLKKIYAEDQLSVLQGFADRVLRYEVECHAPGLSYLYLKDICGSEDKVWRKYVRRYKNYRANGYFVDDYGVRRGTADNCQPLTQDHKRFISRVSKVMGKSSYKFTLSGESFSGSPFEEDIPQYQRFTFAHFKRCYRSLLIFLNEYSLTSLRDYDILLRLVGDESARGKGALLANIRFRQELARLLGSGVNVKEVSYSQFIFIRNALTKHTWSELLENNFVSKRVFYRYKKIFNLLGVYNNTETTKIFTDSDSFRLYQEFVTSNRAFLKIRNYTF